MRRACFSGSPHLDFRRFRTRTGNVITTVKNIASSKEGFLGVTTRVATSVRKALGDDTSDSDPRFEELMRMVKARWQALGEHLARSLTLQSLPAR